MEIKEIKVLLIEDNRVDAAIIQDMLNQSRKEKFYVEIAPTLAKGLESLAKNNIDIALADLTLPDSIGLDTFGRIHAHAPKIPVIIITSSANETQALTAFQKGAQDYLVKGQFDNNLLERSIRYAIERNKNRLELRSMQDKLQKINSCFLSFGEDPMENICRLTAIFGEMLGATCALYNCMDAKQMLCSVGQWHTPEDFNPKDEPRGHICYDVITKGAGRVFLIRNLQDTEYARTDVNVKNYKLQTYLGYPIRWNNSIVGSLCAVYQDDYVPSEEDMKLADIIAGAIEVEERRKHSEEALKEGEERFRIIFESTTDSIVVWDKDYNYLYANQASIDYVGTTRDKVIGKDIRGGLGHIPDFMQMWMKRIDKVFQTQKPMRIEDACLMGDKFVYSESLLSPLRDKNGDVFAVALVYRDITDRKQSELELEKINKELVRSNKRLNQLALKDMQTGLYNHKYLAEIMDSEFDRVKRYGGSLSITMLDIDFFKSINDMYGHQFGDMIIKQLAQQLRKMTRQYDVVIRYGGEEFLIISTGTSRAQALVLGQRILDNIGLHHFGDKKNSVKLKISLAVASYPEDKAHSAMDLIKTTEQILSRAKDEGGNRVYSSLDKKKTGKEIRGSRTEEISMLRQRLEKLNKQANQNLIESIFAFAKTIEMKDHYTGEHAEKTVRYATGIASGLGLPKYETEMIKQAAILHDLGKIGISDKILLKKSKLTTKEMGEIRRHPGIAADILRPIHVLNSIIPFILHHHERWDGRGYPDGLKGEDIPLGARIVAIADVYQALISNRPYRRAFHKKEAIKIIEESSGKQFDPKIVDIFLSILKKEKHH
ncbi:MAG: diguanylate cyclase [Candidatus Omnitrophota bacterium]|nr:diguanylate cyclase [Candidatus Omnitrophota bacterium]